MTKPVSGWAIVHKKSGIMPQTIRSLRRDCIKDHLKSMVADDRFGLASMRRAGYSCEKVTITLK